MSSDKRRTGLGHSDSEFSFQQAFLSSLQAISNPSIRKTATQDLKDLLRHYVDSPSRLHATLSLIAKAAEGPEKTFSKAEVLQSLGILVEIFQGKLLEFNAKILQIILTMLTDEDPDLHVPLRDTLGKVVKYIINTADRAEGIREAQNVFESLWHMYRGTSKCTQMGTALCISKVLQVCKEEILRDYTDRISSKLVRLIKKPESKGKLQLMECIMNLILLVENNSNHLAKIINTVLPTVKDSIVDAQPSIRKMALEILNYMIVVAGETLAPYKNELIDAVGQLKQDKETDIQDAAFKVINSLKGIKGGSHEKSFHAQKTLGRSPNRSAQKERPHEKPKYEQQKSHKDPKKPGILKDSSYNNSPLIVTPEEIQGSQSLYRTSKDKINVGPFTTKNTNLPAGSPLERKFYSPNGLLTSHNPITKEVSRFDTKYADPRETKKSGGKSTKDRKKNRSNTPSMNGDKSPVTPPVRPEQPEFEKNRKPEVFSDVISTRQFTGDGSKKSNASSPAQPEITQANLTEILAQLNSINHKQTMLMQGLDQLRYSTHDELSILKNRLNQLEGLVGKLYVQQKENTSTRTSAVLSEARHPLQISYSQTFAQDQSIENSGYGMKSSEKTGKDDNWEGHDRSRVQERWRESDEEKPKETKPQKQMLWMKIETLLKQKSFTEAYELCLEEGDEEALLCLMKDTGPIVEKLKGNLGELLLNKMKSKLYDSETRPFLLDWIQRALLTRVPIAKGTLMALQGIIRQISEYNRGLSEQEREQVKKVYDYIGILLDSLQTSGEQEETKPRHKLKK